MSKLDESEFSIITEKKLKMQVNSKHFLFSEWQMDFLLEPYL
jgi:hypothetical protein